MVYTSYKELNKSKKPGDKVFGVPKAAFEYIRPEKWPDIQIVEGTLQSSYYEHPNKGPYLPRHLMPAEPVEGHPWDDLWWDVSNWVICDTKEEAEGELEKQMREAIQKMKEQILMLEHLLPSMKNPAVNDKGELIVPPVYRRDMSATFKEVMSHCTGKEPDMSVGELFTFTEFEGQVTSGAIMDSDGDGDLVIDGRTYDNIYIWCSMRRIVVGDRFEISFGRMDEIFKGHDLKVLWYNK